ncbi:hypothetical protein Aperf_G00000105515 [Anoplocephala perfoliata]
MSVNFFSKLALTTWLKAIQDENPSQKVLSTTLELTPPPTTSTPVTAKSPFSIGNVVRRPAPRPPVNTAQQSTPCPPSPPVNPSLHNPPLLPNGVISNPFRDDMRKRICDLIISDSHLDYLTEDAECLRRQPQPLSTFARNPISQMSTEESLQTSDPGHPLPKLPIQQLPSFEEEPVHSSTLSKISEEDETASQASTVVVVIQSHHPPHQHRSSNSPSASVSTTSSSTTLPLSSSPQPTRSSVHSTPAESSDTEEDGPIENSSQRSKRTSKRDSRGSTKRHRASRWGSHQGTDKEGGSTPSSEGDFDAVSRFKTSTSISVPQKDSIPTNQRGVSPTIWQLRDPSLGETHSAFIDLRKPPPPPPPCTTTSAPETPTTTIITASNTPANPAATLKVATSLAITASHPAPPPPPKRSPQTVLTG